VQFVLLASVWWLARNGEAPPTQRDVAEHARTDPMMTSQVLRVLERRGLVTRARDPDDRRARRLSPTARGTRLAERAIAVVEAADRAFFEAAEPDVVLRVLRLLDGPGR
jgi:DNA-binding MarR family transcriptional regulator